MTNPIDPAPDAVKRYVRQLRIFAWVLVAIVVCWQFKVSVKNAWMRDDGRDKISDFTAFYAAGKLALKGEDIYDFKSSGISRRPYLYPPTFAIFPMMGLAQLPHNAALVVFTLLNFILIFGTFRLLRDALWRTRSEIDQAYALTAADSAFGAAFRQWLLLPETGMMLAAAVCSRFIISNTRHANANLYVVFALALALRLMVQYRRQLFEFLSGVAVAWATAIKVTPGIFGVYLLWSRRVWGMLGGAVGLIAFLVLLPAARFGFPETINLLEKYKSHITAAESGEDSEDDPIGHPGAGDQKQLEGGLSVRGVGMRYLTHKAMQFEWAKDDIRFYYVNVVDLPEKTARRVCQAGEFLILALTVILTARHFARTDPGALALSWGLIATAMLLISPLTRKAHLTALMIPAAAMIALIQQRRISGSAKTLCVAALAAVCLQGAFFSVELIGKFRSDWLQGAGLGFGCLLFLFAANAWALRSVEVKR